MPYNYATVSYRGEGGGGTLGPPPNPQKSSLKEISIIKVQYRDYFIIFIQYNTRNKAIYILFYTASQIFHSPKISA